MTSAAAALSEAPCEGVAEALAEIVELRRAQAALHRREVELLVAMRRSAGRRLPDGVHPGDTREVVGAERADRWLRSAEIVAADLAPALEISPLTAVNLVHEADRCQALLRPLLDRLGDETNLDAARLRTAQRMTSEIGDEKVVRVADALARVRDVGTAGQWAAKVRRVIRRVTGTDATAERRHRGVADRHLRFGVVDIHGMCPVSGYLPAADAAELDATLDWMAGTASAVDTRTHEQRRVDALMTTIHGPAALRRTPTPDDPELLDAPFIDADGMVRGVDHDEAELVTLIWEGIRELAAQVDLTMPRVPDRLVDIVVPASILAGADLVRRPDSDYAEATIGRLGEIDPSYARALARDARWRRIVVDPLSEAPIDIGRRQYRPQRRMRERVRLRDGGCRYPGCGRRAARCELDHVCEFRADGSGGATADRNLVSECKQHHRWRHQLGLGVRLEADGTVVWSIHGREYRTRSRPLL